MTGPHGASFADIALSIWNFEALRLRRGQMTWMGAKAACSL